MRNTRQISAADDSVTGGRTDRDIRSASADSGKERAKGIVPEEVPAAVVPSGNVRKSGIPWKCWSIQPDMDQQYRARGHAAVGILTCTFSVLNRY